MTVAVISPRPVNRHAKLQGHGQQADADQTRKKLVNNITVKIYSVANLLTIPAEPDAAIIGNIRSASGACCLRRCSHDVNE